MGLLDTLENLANPSNPASSVSPSDQSKVTGGLMQTLDEHPGGLQGVIDNFRNNGMDQHVQNWSTGQQSTAIPGQIHQGLGGGFVDTPPRRPGRLAGRA